MKFLLILQKNIFCKGLSHKLTFLCFIPLWDFIWIYHLTHAGKRLIKKVNRSNIRLHLHNVILGIIKYSHDKKYSWFFAWRKYFHERNVVVNSNWNRCFSIAETELHKNFTVIWNNHPNFSQSLYPWKWRFQITFPSKQSHLWWKLDKMMKISLISFLLATPL